MLFPVSADGGRTAALGSALPRRDPDVQIEISFDRLVYNGSLKQVGTFVQTFRGTEVYQLKAEHGKWICKNMNNAMFGKINTIKENFAEQILIVSTSCSLNKHWDNLSCKKEP